MCISVSAFHEKQHYSMTGEYETTTTTPVYYFNTLIAIIANISGTPGYDYNY